MNKFRLAAGLRAGPLGKLSAPPETLQPVPGKDGGKGGREAAQEVVKSGRLCVV